MAKMDWGSMMGAMDSVENGDTRGSRVPLGLGDDLSSVSEADLRPQTAQEMEMKNQKMAANAGDALDADLANPKFQSSAPQPVAQQPQVGRQHKGSYECADMYAQMLESQERGKAIAQGYTPPAEPTAPQATGQQTQRYGGSYVQQVNQLNEQKGSNGGPSLLRGANSNYEDFIREDYNRKRGAIQAIKEKLNALDINTCNPDEIIGGMVRVIKKLNGE